MKTTSISRVIIGGALLALAGCAHTQPRTDNEYFTEANGNFRQGALNIAIDQFHELLDQHPFSEHNEEAELKIAQAHYLAGDYAEAVVALSDFQRRHPTSPHLPFVGYCLGMCYVKQMGSIDTDQTSAQNAHTYFVTVARQYPDSPYALLANEQLASCRQALAEHELYVANFYWTHDNDKAAEIRLLTMASRYPETDASAEGLLQLGQYYQRNHQDELAVLAYRSILESNPKTPQAESAGAALAKLSDDAAPVSGDPIDQLLAANGRTRSSTQFETVRIPDASALRTAARKPPPPAPGGFGASPTVNSPFGRGRYY